MIGALGGEGSPVFPPVVALRRVERKGGDREKLHSPRGIAF